MLLDLVENEEGSALRWLKFLFCLAVWTAAAPVRSEPPQWIWGQADAAKEAAVGRCDFRKSFDLAKSDLARVESAQLSISCDDRYVLRMNGRLIGLGANWKQWTSYDVAPLLKEGQNTLDVRCRNDSSAAGLIIQLDVKHTDGTGQRIVTDASWQARLQRAGTWDPTIVDRTPWKPAHMLGQYPHAGPWNTLQAANEVRAAAKVSRLADGKFQLEDGDRVVFLGGTFVERSQRYGLLEASLHSAFPGKRIAFRNLGWSGDTVFGHARARFGTVADGFEHLETHVFAESPTVVFAAYGTNESFAGADGLEAFSAGLSELIDVLQATGAHIVLVTPMPLENLGPPLPDPTQRNTNLKLYRDRMLELANVRNCGIVDLFKRLPEVVAEFGETGTLTDNGMHLHRRGYWYAAQAVLAELGLERTTVHVQVAAEQGQIQIRGGESVNASAARVERNSVQFDMRANHVAIPQPDAVSHIRVSRTVQPEDSVWRIEVDGLATGRYSVKVDGQVVAGASAQQLAEGIALTRGTVVDRPRKLIDEINRKNELYFHRWRPQNETYLFLFRKHEQGNNAVEIPMFDPLIEEVEQVIAPLTLPMNHRVEISPESQSNARP